MKSPGSNSKCNKQCKNVMINIHFHDYVQQNYSFKKLKAQCFSSGVVLLVWFLIGHETALMTWRVCQLQPVSSTAVVCFSLLCRPPCWTCFVVSLNPTSPWTKVGKVGVGAPLTSTWRSVLVTPKPVCFTQFKLPCKPLQTQSNWSQLRVAGSPVGAMLVHSCTDVYGNRQNHYIAIQYVSHISGCTCYSLKDKIKWTSLTATSQLALISVAVSLSAGIQTVPVSEKLSDLQSPR